MASRAITNAFILRQVAYSAKRARTIVHVAIITSSRGNFKCELIRIRKADKIILALSLKARYSKDIMTPNDILRRMRYALNLNDPTMLEIFKQGGQTVELVGLKNLLKKEEEPGYAACSDTVLGAFLDGFIVHKRGKKEAEPGQVKRPDQPLTNNAIMRKIRIALELKEEDMLGILKLGEVEISSSELSAFFRKKDHKHYKECGDQFLRSFLKGLAIRYRERSPAQ